LKRIVHGYQDFISLQKKSRCVVCERCIGAWYLAQAIRMRDPYKIVLSSEWIRSITNSYRIRGEYASYVQESEALVKGDVHTDDDRVDVAPSAKLIVQWRKGSLPFEQYGMVKSAHSYLGWPLEIVKAALLEAHGDIDSARTHYRLGLKGVPNWLPEAKTTYEKLNYFLNRLHDADARVGGKDAGTDKSAGPDN
jgi:hypothetical protein